MPEKPKSWAGRRVRKIDLPVVVVLDFLYMQSGAPRFVDIPGYQLPADFVVAELAVEEMPRRFRVVVEHPSFDPVPEGGAPPPIDPRPLPWWRYALATEAELEARRLAGAGLGSPVAAGERTEK